MPIDCTIKKWGGAPVSLMTMEAHFIVITGLLRGI